MRSYLIAGNWKMNLGPSAAGTLIRSVRQGLDGLNLERVTVLVCPPFVSIAEAVFEAEDSALLVGAQNVHEKAEGAYTGEISAPMLADCGVSHAIVGHSERRQYFGETDAVIGSKAQALLASGLTPIICVGETIDERRAGREQDVVRTQLQGCLAGIDAEAAQNVVIAYEPVWAIGTGETATPQQAQDMHAFIRAELAALYSQPVATGMPILYGGSMKPDNAEELLACPDVDGGLIGGASLKADAFLNIVKTAVSQAS